MRVAILVACGLALGPVNASEPGQAMDCSDWVMVEPGLACQEVIPPECRENPMCIRGSTKAADNDGGLLVVRSRPVPDGSVCPGNPFNFERLRTEIVRLKNGSESVLAYVEDRCGADGSLSIDRLRAPDVGCRGDCQLYDAGPVVTFDDKLGRLYFALDRGCASGSGGACFTYPVGRTLVAFSGFTTTFEVLQTYTPSASIGFRVPYMPEGMPAADHFDTYWGALTKPLDFTQAQPLQCDYPATPPAIGDYLTVTDTVPTPAPGHGVYYVTAATYQGQTRYGRRASSGVVSGRDPAQLAACVASP